MMPPCLINLRAVSLDQMMHQHKLEMNKLEKDVSELKMAMGSYSAIGGEASFLPCFLPLLCPLCWARLCPSPCVCSNAFTAKTLPLPRGLQALELAVGMARRLQR